MYKRQLAWCTRRARATIDIDVNVLVPTAEWERAIAALPTGVEVPAAARKALARDGQVRVWWGRTPLDLFLNNTDFHAEIEDRIRWEELGGRKIPFLSCFDLAVFKAFFNRTKDWADLEEMQAAGTLDRERVQVTLGRYLGMDDERVAKLGALSGE